MSDNIEETQTKLFEVEKPVEKKTKSKGEEKIEVPATYKVKKGDTVYKIAHKYGLTQGQIVSLNKIEDPRALKVDQVLKLRG